MPPRTTQKVQCNICFKEFSAQGLGTHVKACQKRALPIGRGEQEALNGAINLMRTKEIEQGLAVAKAVGTISQPPTVAQPVNQHADVRAMFSDPPSAIFDWDKDGDTSFNNAVPELDLPEAVQPSPVPDTTSQNRTSILQTFLEATAMFDAVPQCSDISIQFHPSADKPPKTIPLHEYRPLTYHNTKPCNSPAPKVDRKPWAPFRTRLDFEIAELTLATHMNTDQINILFSILEKCANNPKDLTLRRASDLEKVWEAARTCHATQFVKKEYTATYKKEEIPFEIYVRPLDRWCRDLLLDPFLLPKFQWNAERHFKPSPDGKKERIIGEPWTANAWWKIQDRLPKGALPFCIILYADKTRLSTFGTVKAYPVIARCANLPCDIRNGSGVGGGIMVGWLPIVEESSETGKVPFTNFKRVVWHKGFYQILVSIHQHAISGMRVRCADDLMRWFFFFILILSADYEEHCVMALIRGSTGNYPCPVCLVPHDELGDLTKTYRLRTTQEMHKVYDDSQKLNAKDRNQLLKDFGLRDVENVFWMMDGSDVYSAVSWDRLHAYHSGLFSDHLWSEFKEIIDHLGRDSVELVDRQFNLAPRWPGLNHFSSVIKTGEFADGSKYEDMAKLIIFCSHNVLASHKTERGYCLLKLLRSFVELDMYSSLTIHTDTTIAGLSAELLNFAEILEASLEYIDLHDEKNWNFPKNHSHLHMIRDILEKGVTRNSNTKPNEKAHGILKLWYRFHTNFKKIAPQILKLNEQDLVAMLIRMAIDFLDEHEAAEASTEGADHVPVSNPTFPGSSRPNENLVLIGSPSNEITLDAFQQDHHGDHAFERFRTKLGQYLMRRFDQHIRLPGSTKIKPYHLARIEYQSLIDWTVQRDLVRVSPSFHGRPRNDFVLIKATDTQYVIGQLLTIFTVTLGDVEHGLAHVLPFDGTIDQRTILSRQRDKDLRFIRVRARRRVDSVLVDLQCLERGCLIIQDHGNDANDSIVIDVTDQDMWWRFKVRKLGSNLRL